MKESEDKMEENKTVQEAEVKPSQLHYDAFISYRHCDLDKFVAENLHKKLEAYRMPADVAKKRQGMKNKIERVFRDQEELPLTSDLNDPIMSALHNSDWLIVICSPRLRESVWCKKEIETFVKLRGRQKVLAVLVEGEPSESFPDELLFETKTVTKGDGSVEEVKVPVEPLAADVRGKNKKDILKNMDIELLRILAAMFHLNFDDLRQRHKEQEHKRNMRRMTLWAFICLIIAAVSVGVALQLNRKNQTIQSLSDNLSEQNELMKVEQAKSLANQALQYLDEGNREAAIESATMAMTQYEVLTMPYTEEAHFALTQSLRAYDLGVAFSPQYQIETLGIVRDISVSKDGNTLAVYDDTGTLELYDLATRSKIFELPSGGEGTSYKDGYVFLAENRFAFWNASSEVKIYDIGKREIIKTLEEDHFSAVYTDPTGKYLIAGRLFGGFLVYDAVTLECLGRAPEGEGRGMPFGVSVNTEGVLSWAYDIGIEEDLYEVYFADCNTMEMKSSLILKDINAVDDIAVKGNTAYILAGYNSPNSPTESFCYVCATDINTGAIIWEDKQLSCFTKMICLPESDTGNALLVVTDQDLRLLDMDNGEIICKMATSSSVIEAYSTDGSIAFDIYCEDGTYLIADPTVSYPMDLSRSFDCKTEDNMLYVVTPYEILVVEENDNHITAYTKQRAEKIVLTEDEVEIPEPVCFYNQEAQTRAKEYNLENANYVYSLFTDDNEMIAFVTYYNGDIVIYSIYEDLTYRIEDGNTLTGYLGKGEFIVDDEGTTKEYTFVSCIGGGYVLSADYKKVMFIPNMVAVSTEQNKVYISGYDGFYEAPIYTKEDLIQMAPQP